MSDAATEAWKWLRTAPLPVVLALVLPAGSYLLYAQQTQGREQVRQAEQIQAAKEEDAQLLTRIGKMDEKLDKLLEAVLQSRAEQKTMQDRLDRAQARRDAQKDDKAKEGPKP